MDVEKLSVVLKWPHPLGLWAMHHFLGFANYYQPFIPHFSSLVVPSIILTNKDVSSKNWTQAESAFEE